MVYRGIQLTNDIPETEVAKLASLKDSYADDLLESVDSLFPEIVLDKADPEWTKNQDRITSLAELDHRFWAEESYNDAKFIEAVRFLTKKTYVPVGLKRNFQALRQNIIDDEEFFCKYQHAQPGAFWSLVMEKFTIDNKLKEVICTALVVPLGKSFKSHIKM